MNCGNEKNDLVYEKKVMDEIFIELVAYLYEPRIPPPPPPPHSLKNIPFEYFKTENQFIKDSIYNSSNEKTRNAIDRHETINEEILKQFEKFQLEKNLLIVVSDTIRQVCLENIKYAEKKLNIDFNNLTSIDSIEYKIDLQKHKKSERYQFSYRSKYPEGSAIWRWRNETNSKLSASIGFSRIIFDKNKKWGLLRVGISTGKLSGHRGIIIIKRINNKWSIVDYLGLCIS